MSSIHNYSIKQILSDNNKCYLLTLEFDGFRKSFYIYNLESLQQKVIAIEYKHGFIDNPAPNKKSELTFHGKYVLNYNKDYKISFAIEGTVLNGNYLLIVPSWGRSVSHTLWVFFNTN